MLILYKLLLVYIIFKINAEKIVSDESKSDQNMRKDKNRYSNKARRFLEDLDDKEWHISHLKETDFTEDGRRSGCAEDTFEEKVNKYRKSLRHDGALVEYVSADALPFNIKDLRKDVCKIPEPKPSIFEASKTLLVSQIHEPLVTTTTKSALKGDPKASDEKEEMNVATTSEKGDTRPTVKQGGRKAAEYAFSSVEYYDESPTWDEALCPDAVEVIPLELDHIRPYDLRCEQVLLWRSLE